MASSPYDDPNFVGPVQPTSRPTPGQEALAAAAGIAPGLIARVTSGGANSNVPPELQQLLAQQVARNQYQNPLFQAATTQAFQGLPAYARDGLSLGSLGPATTSPMGGGGSLGAGLAGGAGGAILGALLTNSGRLAPWVTQALHALLGGQAATDANTFVGPTLAQAGQTTESGGVHLPFGGGGNGGSNMSAAIGTNLYNNLTNAGLAGLLNLGPSQGVGTQGTADPNHGPFAY